jgi:hypothetical protein
LFKLVTARLRFIRALWMFELDMFTVSEEKFLGTNLHKQKYNDHEHRRV